MTATTADHPDVEVLNHAWHDPNALALLGDIPAEDIERLSGGLFRQTVAVRLSREVLGYADPATIDPAEWATREDPRLRVIPRAGETLYRLRG